MYHAVSIRYTEREINSLDFYHIITEDAYKIRRLKKKRGRAYRGKRRVEIEVFEVEFLVKKKKKKYSNKMFIFS